MHTVNHVTTYPKRHARSANVRAMRPADAGIRLAVDLRRAIAALKEFDQ